VSSSNPVAHEGISIYGNVFPGSGYGNPAGELISWGGKTPVNSMLDFVKITG
jgi:hypothetical protein